MAKKTLAELNPYRKDSAYFHAFNVLHQLGLKKPVSRKTLIERTSKLTNKSPRKTAYDVAVICSSRETGEHHKSCKAEHYWVERLPEPSMVRLHLR